MKRTILSVALFTALSTSAMATDNTWEKDAKDAWIDGKAEATLLFNGNLNSFNINTDVNMGKVTLTGKVENGIDKKLAEELVYGIDGVTEVNNMLTVMATETDMDEDDEETSGFTDAKISTVVKSRLLFDSDVSGMAIDVDVDNRVVTLEGDVETEEQRQLAVAIASNTDDVESVNDELRIVPKSEKMKKAEMVDDKPMTR